MSASAVAVQPVVNWPRSAQAGQRYLVTVDVVLAEPMEWPYDREEFIIGCVLDGGDAFTVEALASTSVVLHRFGGTYGPVQFAARAERDPAADGSDMLRLTLVTEGGLPFEMIQLPVLPEGADTRLAAAAYAKWTRTTRERPAPAWATTPRTTDGTERQKRPTARRTALLIGVNLTELRGVENDVEAMARVLAMYGFTTHRILQSDATRDRILESFETITAEAGPDDAVFVYFSGSGGVFTVPAPDASDRPNSPSHLLVPFIVPIDFHDTQGFPAITSIEIAMLLARLAAKTPNIVAAYDTCHGAAPARMVVGALSRSGNLGDVSVPRLDMAAPHIETLQAAGARILGMTHPDIVELHACGPHESAFEMAGDDGRHMGVFSAALAGALEEAAVLQVTWAALFDHVRRRLARTIGRDQHPMISGPARRLLFSTSVAELETTLPIVAEGPNRARILGAALLAVQPGDEFAVMPAGATEPDEVTRIGNAIVDEVVATEAAARLDLRAGVTAIPIGARAHRVKAMAPLLPVKLQPHPDLEEIIAAISANPLLRPAADDEPSEYEVRISDAGDVTIHDWIGPLSDPVPATAAHSIVTSLARLARAAALRALADDSRWALDDQVIVEWGAVVNGRQDPNPLSGGIVHVGQRVYVRVRNDGTEPVFVSLIDIGVAAEVTVLTHFAPAGLRLDSGREFTIGAPGQDAAIGIEIVWPRGLDDSRARVETIIILTTSEPLDVGVLQQAGVRALPARNRSPLGQYLEQAVTGSPRYPMHLSEATVRYCVRSIDFSLDPRPFPPDDGYSSGTGNFDAQNPDELRALCVSFRTEPIRRTDDGLVRQIESAVDEYRRSYADRREPPAPLDELLPLMGWLIYEASWESVQRISPGFDRLGATDDRRQVSETAMDQINRLADVARRLPWPEFAPRALGAIRSAALAESKRDTEPGFDAAWLLHTEVRRRYDDYRGSHGPYPNRKKYVLALNEMSLQLALAEVGTACRTAERVIGRWAEEYGELAEQSTVRADTEQKWAQRLFRQLNDGMDVGERAINMAAEIRANYGFVDAVSEERLTMRTAWQNAGIMTARTALLLLALWHEVERLGLRPPSGPTWSLWEQDLLRRFERAYRAIEDRDGDVGHNQVILRPDYQRHYVSLRLTLGLLKPGYDLRAGLDFAACLERNPIDAAAVHELSTWLAGEERNWRGFAAATMPSFIRSVIACRDQGPGDTGYQKWRRDWFACEAFADEKDRRGRVEAALIAAEQGTS